MGQESKSNLIRTNCISCGLPFPVLGLHPNLQICKICSKNGIFEPVFEDIVYSVAVGYFQRVKKLDIQVAVAQAREYVCKLPYWVQKKTSDLNSLLNNLNRINRLIDLEDLDQKLSFEYFILSFHEESTAKFCCDLESLLNKHNSRNLQISNNLSSEDLEPDEMLLKILIRSKLCLIVLTKEAFNSHDFVAQIETVFKLKTKEQIIPIWWNEITTDFLSMQPLGAEITGTVSIPWGSFNGNVESLVQNLLKLKNEMNKQLNYGGVILVKEEGEALQKLQEIIGDPNPIPNSDTKYGFLTYEGHVTKLILRENNENKKIGPIILPDICSRFRTLESLEGNISTIPEWIGSLTNLKELILEQNDIRSIPSSIGNLKSLRILNLKGNRLETLPNSITDLQSLQILQLEHNKLKELPYNIGNLESLQILQLNENKLRELPESIGDLHSLKELFLSNNELNTITKSIGKLKSINKIVLTFNQLKSIPLEIEDLKTLKELDISSNDLMVYSKKIMKLINSLRERDCSVSRTIIFR